MLLTPPYLSYGHAVAIATHATNTMATSRALATMVMLSVSKVLVV